MPSQTEKPLWSELSNNGAQCTHIVYHDGQKLEFAVTFNHTIVWCNCHDKFKGKNSLIKSGLVKKIKPKPGCLTTKYQLVLSKRQTSIVQHDEKTFIIVGLPEPLFTDNIVAYNSSDGCHGTEYRSFLTAEQAQKWIDEQITKMKHCINRLAKKPIVYKQKNFTN